MKGRNWRYWNIEPSKKSFNRVKVKLKTYLKKNGHKNPYLLSQELNTKLRGWLNYFEIPGVSYPARIKRKLGWYLAQRIYRFYKRKSQRKCKLYNQGALEILVKKYGLIDPTKHFLKETANA